MVPRRATDQPAHGTLDPIAARGSSTPPEMARHGTPSCHNVAGRFSPEDGGRLARVPIPDRQDAVASTGQPANRRRPPYQAPHRPARDRAGGRSAAEGATNVLHQQNEVHIVGRARLEVGYEVEVEGPSLFGLGVHEQAATTDVLRELDKPDEEVLQQGRPQSPALVIHIDAQPGEDGDRLGIAASSFAEALRRGLGVNLGHAPGVVGNNSVTAAFSDDEDPRASDAGRLARVTTQPLGLLRGTALESAQIVVVGEQLRRSVSPAHSVNGEGRCSSRRRPGSS